MHETLLDLMPATAGTRHGLVVQRFGAPQARPHAVLQAALHADELPGILVLQLLRTRLRAAELAGSLRGSVTLVPFANPLGLAQQGLGHPVGRFALADGSNFNRGFPWLADAAAAALEQAPADADVRATVRRAMAEALAARRPRNVVEQLKQTLLGLAIDADLVLDLHCDGEALMHLYTLTPQADMGAQLGRLLGARAHLVADDSGDHPFDEACSRPWLELQRRFPDRGVPLACFAATVELRGQADVDQQLAASDAAALHDFLVLQGVVDGPEPMMPAALCAPTPLAGSEPIESPVGGIVAFRARPGALLAADDPVADVVDPATGASTVLRASAPGLLYARIAGRLVTPGQRVAKVAGTALQRTGRLLSP